MNIRKHIRTLAMASMLALAVVSIPVGHVHAQPKGQGGGDGTCIADNGLMYNVGDIYTDSNGNRWVCTEQGDFLMVPRLLQTLHSPVAPLPIRGIFGR